MSSDSADDTSSDSDSSNIAETDSLFSAIQHVHCKFVGLNYILDISATSDTNPYVATALSDFSCKIFDFTENRLAEIAILKGHQKKIIGCKFSPCDNNLLYTASNDGTVKLWDLRDLKGKEVCVVFKDTTIDDKSVKKSFSSFDVTPCNRLLAAGTELIEGDAYILFWDVRNVKLLGAYWESHNDDITQVKFHPEDSNKLISGSTDGLINIYNLMESSEEDALEDCLNTDSLVKHLDWFKSNNKRWKISCITTTNDLQLWEMDGVESYNSITRDKISEKLMKKTDSIYIARVHAIKDNLFALCGSNKHDGKSLNSVIITEDKIIPAFQFKENTQIIRASYYNENTNILLTGGEKGELQIWKPDFTEIDFKFSTRRK